MTVQVLHGDCLLLLRDLPAESLDACVTDPPYHLTTGKRGGFGPASASSRTPQGRARIGTGFMGKAWDGGDIAFREELWAEVLRVLKPGAHLLAFGATRTYHHMACAIEAAGFEIRDCIRSEQGRELAWPGWLYGTGMPKSRDMAKAIDAEGGTRGEVVPIGAARARMVPGADQNATGCWAKDGARTYQPGEYVPGSDAAARWQGFGTGLKPAWEPIVVARKPIVGTVAANLQRHGTGALNIDASRIETDESLNGGAYALAGGERHDGDESWRFGRTGDAGAFVQPEGRWPANVVHDGSPEVLETFALFGKSGTAANDAGSPARFFFSGKAGKLERGDFGHPTVKPLPLMEYLVRLVTPPGGTVLDCFAGTGTTGLACQRLGFSAVLMEADPGYAAGLHRRFGGGQEVGPLFAA